MGIGSGGKCHFHFQLLTNNQAKFLEMELLQIKSVQTILIGYIVKFESSLKSYFIFIAFQ